MAQGDDIVVIEIGVWGLAAIAVILISIAFTAYYAYDQLRPKLNLRVECFPNQTVVVSGRLIAGFSPIPDVYIAIQVSDQNGTIVWLDAIKTVEDGRFSISFALSSESKGEYVVYANSDMVSEKESFIAN